MSKVEHREVSRDEDSIRLDRWFLLHYPTLGYGRLQKLLRTGQVRVDGSRAKAALRLASGQSVRVPPLTEDAAAASPRPRPPVDPADAEFVRGLVIHRDDDVLVLDKPAGLAVQGGTGTFRHLDAMLDALKFDAAERPRLVHRLDRDTSGVLLLARNRQAATRLGRIFRGRDARKIYWAATVGIPRPAQGRIDLALRKTAGRTDGRVVADAEDGKRAVTWFRTLDRSGNRVAWVAFWPRTGRTHQIRVHAAAMDTPILGDGKYGGAGAFVQNADVARQLHLHARAIILPHPSGRGVLRAHADLPPHMRRAWSAFGFAAEAPDDPFEEVA